MEMARVKVLNPPSTGECESHAPSQCSHNTDAVDVHGEPFYIHDVNFTTGDDNIAGHANNTLVEDSYFGSGHGSKHTIEKQNVVLSGFEMCFAIGSQHFWCRGSQPKHVSNPAYRSLNPVLFVIVLHSKVPPSAPCATTGSPTSLSGTSHSTGPRVVLG